MLNISGEMSMGSKSFADHLPHQKRGSEWIDQVMKWIIQVTDWTEWIEMKKVRLISGLAETVQSANEIGYEGLREKQIEQLIRTIYGSLVEEEKQCIMMNKQAESKAEVSSTRWQELISVHRTLLDKHCEFFVSHHPSGHRVLMQLPEKYGMPSRLWSYGIQQLLEKFRQRLPESRDRIQDCTRYYMVDFVHLAYAITKLLLEITPVFKVTWMECLGDLARYSMAVEGSDLRKGWTAVSRYWYEQTEGCNPDVGRIQHHLAVARPDVLQQLFYYTKALVCPQPFHKARESIVLLLEPFNDQLLHQPSLTTALSKTHAIIFTKGPTEQFITQANNFMFFFGEQSSRLGLHWRKVVHIMSVNFASVLQYGEPEGVQSGLPRQQNNIFPETHAVALQWYSGAAAASFSGGKSARNNGDTALEIASPVAFQASCLAFHTFAILIKQMGDFKAYPGIHVSMVFIWCLALRPSAMQQVEPLVPWLELTKFLNTLVTDTNLAMVVEGETFPLSNDRTRHLPEDFLIRGHVWSQVYYPEKFFEGPPSEVIKEQEIISVRRQRCLWLGAMIAKLKRWMTLNTTGTFEATPLARKFAQTAKTL